MDAIVEYLKNTFQLFDAFHLPITLFGVGFYVVLLMVERLIPAQSSQGLYGKFRNVVFGLIRYVLGTILVISLVGWLPWKLEIRGGGGAAETALYVFKFLFLSDLLYYWHHRAQHSFRWFWPIHEMHHSDAELNVTTSYRTYWLETPLQYLFVLSPVLLILGLDVRGVFWGAIAATGMLLFTHSNLRISFGQLSWILCGPQVHRIHHSIQSQHSGRNLAQYFPIIDVIFGTYHAPGKSEYPPTGTSSQKSDAPVISVMMKPFRTWFSKR